MIAVAAAACAKTYDDSRNSATCAQTRSSTYRNSYVSVQKFDSKKKKKEITNTRDLHHRLEFSKR